MEAKNDSPNFEYYKKGEVLETLLTKKTKNQREKRVFTHCYHCGETCDKTIVADEKYFCCDGCKFVYQLLQENGLCNYYDLTTRPGIKARGKYASEHFAYLDNEEINNKLLRFRDEKQCHTVFYLPQMHCASCIWLLENLHSIQPGILFSKTNFSRKEIFISYDPAQTSLRKAVELLAFIGYEPYISFKEGETKKARKINRSKIFKIGIAGFCFSNIMMLSFPDYFSSGNVDQPYLDKVFIWLSLGLSLPVFFYSASEFFVSAWQGLRQKWLNIDAPIALAILITFARSVYDIVSGTGTGYLDSMSGVVFFMLIGRWFQDKTYDSFSFDRDYKSYFPLGVTVLKKGMEETTMINAVKKDDIILVRNHEMIPADAIIVRGEGNIDYSFVSGENTPVLKKRGELIYAGGKQSGSVLELRVVNPVEQSYITQLWNNKESFIGQKNKDRSFIHPWSRYFTIVLFAIAAVTGVYWAFADPTKILPAITAALIVACPCSLLLSATFTYGTMLRHFGKNKFYLKNSSVIEAISKINTIVFDKTGTLTHSSRVNVSYEGRQLSTKERNAVYSLVKGSVHPLSRALKQNILENFKADPLPVSSFREIAGKGIEGMVNNDLYKVGSWQFVNDDESISGVTGSGLVFVSINKIYAGAFRIGNQYREGVEKMLQEFSKGKYELHVLSGDNDAEEEKLISMLGKNTRLYFNQTPQDKLDYVETLKKDDPSKKVMMLGDGINDAGALQASDVGIAVSEKTSQFTPACDAILDSTEVNKLLPFIHYARSGRKIITASFIISIGYNIVGLAFAVQALLSPVVAAILMPASSITIVALVTMAASMAAKKKGL